MSWLIDLTGLTAVVSGASRGIGREIAAGLARAGSSVVGLARSKDALEELREELGAAGHEFLPVVVDVADVRELPDAVAAAWDWHGGVDVLVNTAGTVVRRDPPDVTPEDWDTVFDVNTRGTFFLTQALGTRMREAGRGCVVNVASLAGEVVTGAPVSYQASKAALIQMTRALAIRWAPAVRVNAVGPGYIRTSLNEAWFADRDNERWVVERTPLERVGTVDDVVGAVVFLASPAAGFITGQHLLVDGGWSAQ